MTQAQLNRAVARVTGETVSRVEQLGFNLIVVPDCPTPIRHSSSRRLRGRWWRSRCARKPVGHTAAG